MREMQRGGRRLNVILGLEKIVFILVFFFLSAAWLNRFGSVRFNRFQTLETETETEPNHNFFVIF
jgi:hypothetical protein